ncbi:MAG: hypothetical protein MUP55_00560 [Candidatus Aenigmarchaeota archaeon]|nr:hypothetical protein [Candidatus Aenigmarchaeota archaeon]
MARVNLKELKDALNKLPDDRLEHFYIMHGMATEDPEPKLMLVFYDDEENWDKCREMYDLPETNVLVRFANELWHDAMKGMIGMLDSEKMEDYCDDTE